MIELRRVATATVCAALFLSGCGQTNDADLAELEARIAELEATSTTEPSPTTTTQAPTTTSTTQAPTTTSTTLASLDYDLEGLSLGSLIGWRLDDEVDAEFLAFASQSCETAVDSVRRLAVILSEEMVDAWTQTLAGIDESQAVVRAADAWATISNGIPYAGRAILFLSESGGVGGASRYAEMTDGAITDAIFAVNPFRLLVHDVQAFEIDTRALEIWGDDVVDVVNELQRLAVQPTDTYCAT